MKLFHRELRAGEPLIILHGLFGMSDNWFTIAKRIAGRHHVFLPDLRNHGKSPHSAEFDYDVLVKDVREFLEAHNLHEVKLIGHSLGGKIAMQFALSYPEFVRKSVVIDIAPRAYSNPYFLGLLKLLLDVNTAQLQTRQQADEMLAKSIKEPAVRQFLLKNLERIEQGGFHWKIHLQAIAANLEKILVEIKSDQSFKKETLFVAGSLSDYITQSDVPDIKKLFPKAEVVTISSSSHWVHADAPDRLCEVLAEFL